MYRTISDYNDYANIMKLLDNINSSQNIISLLGDNLNISSASIGYFNILKDEIYSFSDIINLNSKNINLNADNIKINGNLEYNANLKLYDVLIEFGLNPDDMINNRGFIFPWYENNIMRNGFIGFDTTSKTFKMINNIQYNSNTNVSIIPDYNLYSTLEILNLKVSNILSYDGTNVFNNNLTVNNDLLIKNNLILNKNLNLENNIYIQNCPNPLLNGDVSNKYYIDNKKIYHNKVNTGDNYWKIFDNVLDVNNMIIGYNEINNSTYIKKGTPNGSQITLTDQDIIFETKNEIIAMIDANGYYNTLSDINNKHSIRQKKLDRKYIERIKQLKIYSYCYKNEYDNHIHNQIYIGLIKQDIEKLFNGNCLGIKKINSNHICNYDCIKKINKHINYNEILCYNILAFQEHIKDYENFIYFYKILMVIIISLMTMMFIIIIKKN